jgi:hypothetical protein
VLTVLLKAVAQVPKALKAIPLTAKEYQQGAKQLVEDLKALGHTIDIATAEAIIRQAGEPATRAKLQQLVTGLQTLLTAVKG